MIVAKLGGSLYHQPNSLQKWLDKLTKLSNTETIVIVPGGGPFADQVRVAQQHHGFSDTHAHHMALLAMAQFGVLLQGYLPTSKPFRDVAPPSAGLHIWLPSDALLEDTSIKQDWSITSDTLALWLAARIGSEQLHIIKSCEIPDGDITDLSAAGILDAAFPSMHQVIPINTTLFHERDVDNFPDDGIRVS